MKLSRTVFFCAMMATLAVSMGLAPALASSTSQNIPALVTEVATEVSVPVAVAHGLVRLESNYNPSLRGAAGEWGLTQIKCETARGLGFKDPCGRLSEPRTNLYWGLLHLKAAIEIAGLNCEGIALHNRGLNARPRCTPYGRKVLASVEIPASATTASAGPLSMERGDR